MLHFLEILPTSQLILYRRKKFERDTPNDSNSSRECGLFQYASTPAAAALSRSSGSVEDVSIATGIALRRGTSRIFSRI